MQAVPRNTGGPNSRKESIENWEFGGYIPFTALSTPLIMGKTCK